MGGGNNGSSASLKVCYVRTGIILYNMGHDVDRHGLAFTYIKYGLNL